jgi:hypothetical protein
MSANKYFSNQFKDVKQEKLRRRRRYFKRAEARIRFKHPRYE